jgi:phage internal scaffolding protein
MSYQPQNRTNPETPIIKHAYSLTTRIALTFPEDSPYTKQEFAEESDINTIMARYQSTGIMPSMNETYPQFLDVTGNDFAEHMQIIVEARELFESLPSALRERFNNDPARFLDFTSNHAENGAEMAKLGLLTPEATDRYINPPPTPPQTVSTEVQETLPL